MGGVIATAGVVVLDRDRVLLIEHGAGAGHVTGSWGIPAGAIDAGETACAAALRELAEETGLRVAPARLIEIPTVYEARIRRKTGWGRFSLHAFATDRFDDEPRPSEERAPTWIRLDAVSGLRPLLPNTAEVVLAAALLLRTQ